MSLKNIWGSLNRGDLRIPSDSWSLLVQERVLLPWQYSFTTGSTIAYSQVRISRSLGYSSPVWFLQGTLGQTLLVHILRTGGFAVIRAHSAESVYSSAFLISAVRFLWSTFFLLRAYCKWLGQGNIQRRAPWFTGVVLAGSAFV